jgi:L-ascorbate metabolism protein UlaG (beta-lactamase superfamily)
MRVEWYGQSAFRLEGEQATVVIDPFASEFLAMVKDRGMQFDYPPIDGATADLLLITHEHGDHNGVSAVTVPASGPDEPPRVLRSTAGRLPSPIGEVIAVASEHDEEAGTMRGPNTIFAFDLDGVRVCHFGDFGQSALREEQAAALEGVELLIVPVGGGPTIGAAGASAVVERLSPRWVVPMHYRTARVNFLETADEFLARYDDVVHADGSSFDTAALPADGVTVVVPAAP